jgi:hypothetical protein
MDRRYLTYATGRKKHAKGPKRKTYATGRKKHTNVPTIQTGRKREDGTKTEKVLKHLIHVGPITTWEAILLYRVTRLSGVIWTLKNQGFNIVSRKVENDNGRFGRGYHAEYTLMGRVSKNNA